jgi:hypothetical protein
MPKDRAQSTKERLEEINALLAAAPQSDFHELTHSLTKLYQLVHEEIAVRLESPMNVYLRSYDSMRSESKKQLASELTELLGALNLGIHCPVTHRHCLLHASPAHEKNPNGRFELRPRGSQKSTISRAVLNDLLPLKLMSADSRREALTEWRSRAQRSQGDIQER